MTRTLLTVYTYMALYNRQIIHHNCMEYLKQMIDLLSVHKDNLWFKMYSLYNVFLKNYPSFLKLLLKIHIDKQFVHYLNLRIYIFFLE